MDAAAAVLKPWMKRLLWFVGGFNLLAGLTMFVFYHECFKLLGVEKPALILPVQLVGVLVGIFGAGYWMVARDPLLNRNILVLGFWSKALGSVVGLAYVARGELPIAFAVTVFFADIIYLWPFAIIIAHLKRIARGASDTNRNGGRAAA